MRKVGELVEIFREDYIGDKNVSPALIIGIALYGHLIAPTVILLCPDGVIRAFNEKDVGLINSVYTK